MAPVVGIERKSFTTLTIFRAKSDRFVFMDRQQQQKQQQQQQRRRRRHLFKIIQNFYCLGSCIVLR